MNDAMKIRVVLEISSDGMNVTIPSNWHELPNLMPLGRAAKFALSDCLESKALRDWNGPESEYPKR